MAYLYNLSRDILQQKVAKYGQYVHGKVLDAGSGNYSRYKQHFTADSIVRLDIMKSDNVDVVGRLESMPLPSNEFDAILSTQVLEHVEFPEKAVAEMSRVLRAGGHVLVTVPQWNELHEEPHDYWRYTCFGLKALFERNGFETVAYERIGGFFSNRAKMGMRYLIDRFRIYDRPWIRVASGLFRIWGACALWLDEKDNSAANKKHAIGWVFVFKKK